MSAADVRRRLAQLGIPLSHEKGAAMPWVTPSDSPRQTSLAFDSSEAALLYWERVASSVVHGLHLARAVWAASRSISSRDRKNFQEWMDGKRCLMPKRLYQRKYDVFLPATWWTEAVELAKQHGSIANLTFAVLIKGVSQAEGASCDADAAAGISPETSVAGQGL